MNCCALPIIWRCIVWAGNVHLCIHFTSSIQTPRLHMVFGLIGMTESNYCFRLLKICLFFFFFCDFDVFSLVHSELNPNWPSIINSTCDKSQTFIGSKYKNSSVNCCKISNSIQIHIEWVENYAVNTSIRLFNAVYAYSILTTGYEKCVCWKFYYFSVIS